MKFRKLFARLQATNSALVKKAKRMDLNSSYVCVVKRIRMLCGMQLKWALDKQPFLRDS